MPEVLRRIDAARGRGLRVSANVYPYNRASNGLDACLPIWAREGGTDALLNRLKDPATRERIKKDMDDPNAPFENQWYGSGGPAGVMLSSVLKPELRKYEGMNFVEIGKPLIVMSDVTSHATIRAQRHHEAPGRPFPRPAVVAEQQVAVRHGEQAL